MDIKDAMKSAITANTTTERTAATFANDDLIQVYDDSGNPNGKIKKSVFMSAVQASLGSLLNAGSDQTTVAKVPTLNGNTLGASTVATLASVLGVLKCCAGQLKPADDLDNKPQGYWNILSNSGYPQNCPDTTVSSNFFGIGGGESASWGVQLVFPADKDYFYFRTHYGSVFHSWKKVVGTVVTT